MLISQIIDSSLPNLSYRAVAEREVETLGFLSSQAERICIFVGAKKFLKGIPKNASMAIISPDLEDYLDREKMGYIVVDRPREVFWQIHQAMDNGNGLIGESFDTRISETARVSPQAWISPHNVIIGDDVVIEPFVTIYPNTTIEKGCVIRSGSRIGGVGFMEVQINGQLKTMNHYGGVVLHEGVDIHCNSCVDRGIFPGQNTEIGAGTKMDNLVHIGHSVRIGEMCMLAAGTTLAGFSRFGNGVWVGLGAIAKNDLTVGDAARLNIGSVVVDSVADGISVSGNYAIEHGHFLYRQLELRRTES